MPYFEVVIDLRDVSRFDLENQNLLVYKKDGNLVRHYCGWRTRAAHKECDRLWDLWLQGKIYTPYVTVITGSYCTIV